MANVRELYQLGKTILIENNIPDADIDARYLLEFCTGYTSSQFYMNQFTILDEDTRERYLNLIKKRSTHYPLQYITGVQEFMGYEFKVNESVLIPRQDTEILVENVCKMELRGKKVLDMCTGSGCIAISINTIVNDVDVTAVDISTHALAVAMENATMNGASVKFIHSDLFNNVKEKYDYIVSNPPYICTEEIERLMDEVKSYEPRIALDGLDDGLFFYRRIINESIKHLNEYGHIYFEIGYDQGEAVRSLLQDRGFKNIKIIKDLAGLDRVVYGNI